MELVREAIQTEGRHDRIISVVAAALEDEWQRIEVTRSGQVVVEAYREPEAALSAASYDDPDTVLGNEGFTLVEIDGSNELSRLGLPDTPVTRGVVATLVFMRGLTLLSKRGLCPAFLTLKSGEKRLFRQWLGLPEMFPLSRFAGMTVLESPSYPTGALVLLGAATAVSLLRTSSFGVRIHMEVPHG